MLTSFEEHFCVFMPSTKKEAGLLSPFCVSNIIMLCALYCDKTLGYRLGFRLVLGLGYGLGY